MGRFEFFTELPKCIGRVIKIVMDTLQLTKTNSQKIKSDIKERWLLISKALQYTDSVGQHLHKHVAEIMMFAEKNRLHKSPYAKFILDLNQKEWARAYDIFAESLVNISYISIDHPVWTNAKSFCDSVVVRGGFCIVDGKTMRNVTAITDGWEKRREYLYQQLVAGPSLSHILETVLPLRSTNGSPYHVISLEDSLFAQYIGKLMTNDVYISVAQSMDVLRDKDPELLQELQNCAKRVLRGVNNRYKNLYKSTLATKKLDGILWSESLSPDNSLSVLMASELSKVPNIKRAIYRIYANKTNITLWKSLWV